jgi:LysR family transcriptional regulator, nitrogen assimilation regulatory protein
MDLRTLNYVTTAVRLESITKAAARLHIAQSALSRAIRLLEEELGVTLLVRHTHGVKATKDGLKFVESAETLLRLAHQLRDEARSYSAEPLGEIRFGFPPSQGDHFISTLIAGFVKKYPNVNFLLREALSGELTEALLADKLDLAIMLYDTKHQDLQRKALFSEDIWLVGESRIWPFGTKPLNPAQVGGLPLVHTQMVGESLRKLTARQKLRWRTVAQGDVTRIAREMVRSGAAYWLIPHGWIADEIDKGVLSGAPVKGLEVRRGLFWRSDRPQSRAVMAFVDELGNAVAKLKLARPRLIKEIDGAN